VDFAWQVHCVAIYECNAVPRNNNNLVMEWVKFAGASVQKMRMNFCRRDGAGLRKIELKCVISESKVNLNSACIEVLQQLIKQF
jgi:hypothetical protein